MPSTLKRSPPRAERTYEETLGHAEEEYGDFDSRMSKGELAKAIARKR